MSFAARIKYSAFLFVAVAMAVGFVQSIVWPSEADLLMNPLFFVPLAVASFVVSPWISRYMPFQRK
jgi:hypothetical protein